MKTRDDAREREFPAGARREAGGRREFCGTEIETLQNRTVTPFDARDSKQLLRPWRCVRARGAGALWDRAMRLQALGLARIPRPPGAPLIWELELR